jgi:hypothetical protein
MDNINDDGNAGDPDDNNNIGGGNLVHWLLVIVTGWYRTKHLTHSAHFQIYYASPSEF